MTKDEIIADLREMNAWLRQRIDVLEAGRAMTPAERSKNYRKRQSHRHEIVTPERDANVTDFPLEPPSPPISPNSEKESDSESDGGAGGERHDKRDGRRKPERSLPDDFDALIAEEDIDWARQLGFQDQQILLETKTFKAKALAQDWRYRDWKQAWRNWFLQELKYRARAGARAS